jgi:hypothetical protein
MFATAALITLVTLGASSAAPAPLSVAPLPPLQVAGRPVIATTAGSGYVLQSSLFALGGSARSRGSVLAQTTPPAAGAGAGASAGAGTEGAATTAQGEGVAAPAGGEAATSGEAPAGAAAEEEPDIELLRHRERLTRIHRTLGLTTFGALTVTTALGTIAAINQQTLFGAGECRAGGHPIFGLEFGCGTLTTVHKLSAFITVGLYASTGVFALAMPDPEHVTQGNDWRATRLRLHRAAAWVHLAGMILQPIVGIIAVNPGIVGVNGAGIQDFASTMRTIHLGVGYVTWAALGFGMTMELLQ